jgi:hypothetical protein
MDRVISQDWAWRKYKNLPGCFSTLSNVPAAADFFANDGRVLGCTSIGDRSKVKARLGAHLLLRRVGRIRVHFAGNGSARFRCLTGVEFFIGSATAKGNDSAGEESKIPPFHGK